MKKSLIALMIMALVSGMLFASGGQEGNADGTFTPSKDIEWVVTSSPGGGSDIYTRMLSSILNESGLVTETILVNNQTDGGGEVGRLRVSTARSDGHMLLTFNSGDLIPMVRNTPNRLSGFKPVVLLAVDRQILLKGNHTKYADFADAIATAKSGTPVVIGGSRGDDIKTYEMMLAEVGLTENQMPYITYDSTSDAITALLGGHIEFAVSKPAASRQYLESGDAEAILAFANERYTGMLAAVPTLSEIGPYENVESPLWRGIVAPASTPDSAIKFWSDTFKKVSESEEWQEEYITKNLLASMFLPYDEATAYMQKYQDEFMATEGIK